MTKKIKFNPVSQIASLSVPPPKPAASYTPKWYKELSSFGTKQPQFCPMTGETNKTVKKCMPFFDSFQMGYVQETWEDIWVEEKEGKTDLIFPCKPPIVSSRNPVGYEGFPHVEGFLPNHFVWIPSWWPELPAGYSCIITHPFNQEELPFHTFTGIVDCDSFNVCRPDSSLPFMLREGFTGMIKKGTPMYQIIPYKRESWVSSVNSYDEDKINSAIFKVIQHFWDGYKKLHWNKKMFK